MGVGGRAGCTASARVAGATATGLVLGAGMGMAVPGTAAAVMAGVPHGRAGIASATMNALGQAVPRLGIALLGSLMSLRALHCLAASIGRDGAVQARAVLQAPASTLLASPWLGSYRDATASGFAWAMGVAGIIALAAGCSVWRQRATG